jgi:hypothetical protein
MTRVLVAPFMVRPQVAPSREHRHENADQQELSQNRSRTEFHGVPLRVPLSL